jgi:hypothetical protein
MWFYQRGNDKVGPVDDSAVLALISAGAVTAETLVWKKGYDKWMPAKHTDLASLLRASPPPLDNVAGGRGGSVFVQQQNSAPVTAIHENQNKAPSVFGYVCVFSIVAVALLVGLWSNKIIERTATADDKGIINSNLPSRETNNNDIQNRSAVVKQDHSAEISEIESQIWSLEGEMSDIESRQFTPAQAGKRVFAEAYARTYGSVAEQERNFEAKKSADINRVQQKILYLQQKLDYLKRDQ